MVSGRVLLFVVQLVLLSLHILSGAASDEASMFEGDAVYCNAHPSPSALTLNRRQNQGHIL